MVVSPLLDPASVSNEFPLDREPGTARKLCESFPHLDVGDDTLCGEVGLLSLLSKEFAARKSVGDVVVCDSEGASAFVPAVVSMVIVGARALLVGPGELRPSWPCSSAMFAPRLRLVSVRRSAEIGGSRW